MLKSFRSQILYFNLFVNQIYHPFQFVFYVVCKIFLGLENGRNRMSICISNTFHVFFAIGRCLRAGFVAPVARRAVWFQQTLLLVSTSR